MKKVCLKNILLVAVLLSIGLSQLAFAQDAQTNPIQNGGAKSVGGFVGGIALSAVLSPIDAVGYLIGLVASMFVNIGGSLVNWALDLNSQVLISSTVKIGWIVSRDLANLGFVLAMILISLITILRIETYNTQQILVKLILAALLVNFSLVAAGLLLDFSGILTNFFINKATDYAPGQIGTGLASAFQVQKLLLPIDNENAINTLVLGIFQDANTHIMFTASIIFVAIFTTIIAISLISLAAMLFIRYIWLTMLLILMPVAWLCWIWPDIQHLFTKWWSLFMKWAWFAPAVTFFIYLALSIVSNENKDSIMAVGFQAPPNITLKDFGGVLGRMLSVLGILYGGMYTANGMGIAGADAGFAVARGVKTAMLGAAIGGAGLAATGAGRLYSSTVGKGKTFNEDLRGFTAKYSAAPLVGGLMQTANRALVGGTEKRLEEFKKNFSGMDKEARLASLKRDPLLMGEEERAALMSVVAEKNELKDVEELIGKPDGITRDRYNSFVQSTISRGGETAKTLIAKNPTFAGFKIKRSDFGLQSAYDQAVNKEIEKAFDFMKPEAMATIEVDLFKGKPEFINRLKANHLAEFGNTRNYTDKLKFKQYIEEELRTIQGWLATGVPLTDEQRRLVGVAKTINSKRGSVGWTGATINPSLIP